MRKLLKRLWKEEHGQSLAEFAALLPLILLTIGFMLSGGQMIFSSATGYYADDMAARLLIVPNASIQSAEQAGTQILQSAPFNAADKLKISCTKNSVDTTCTTTGVDQLVFPVIGIGGNPIPTTQFNVNIGLTLPTQNPQGSGS